MVSPPAGRSPLRTLLGVSAASLPPLAFAVAWVASDGPVAQAMLGHALYWAMPGVAALWLAALALRLRAARERPRAWLGRNAFGLAAAAIATLVLVACVQPQMRVQFDESTLVGVSRSMHRDRVAMIPLANAPAPGGAFDIEWKLDKRPPLFPFLVSLVHDVAGYRAGNAFVVNGALLFALLALLACRTSRVCGPIAAAAAPPLVLAVPVVAACATSAGFDLLATLLLALVLTAALDFGREPTAARATWLFANAIAFAQARYECVLVLPVVAVMVLLRTRSWPRDRLGRVLLTAAPLLLAPVLLLLVYSRDPTFYPEANGRPLVALAHLLEHLPLLLRECVRPAADNALPGALGLAALAAAVVWIAKRRTVPGTGLVLAPVLTVTLVALLWFFSDPTNPIAVRLYLPLAVLLALGPLLLPLLFARAWLAPLLVLASTAWAGVRVRDLARETTMWPSRWVVSLEAVDTALAGLRPDPQRTLLVSTVAQYLIVRGFAAMTPLVYSKRAREFRLGDVVVLATPCDEINRVQAGDPQDVLRGVGATLLGDVPGEFRVAAWRLGH